MNAATPLGARGCSVVSSAGAILLFPTWPEDWDVSFKSVNHIEYKSKRRNVWTRDVFALSTIDAGGQRSQTKTHLEFNTKIFILHLVHDCFCLQALRA